MSELTPVERKALDGIEGHVNSMHPVGKRVLKGAGVAVADAMRRELPDVGDVTIAKVLRAVSVYISNRHPNEEVVLNAMTILALAAAELTTLERGAEPQQ